MRSSNPTHHEMSALDEHTTRTLGVARKHVEGTKRNVPLTKMNQTKESTMKRIEALMSKAKGKNADEKLMLRRQELLGIDCNNLSKEELEALLKKSSNIIEGAQNGGWLEISATIVGTMKKTEGGGMSALPSQESVELNYPVILVLTPKTFDNNNNFLEVTHRLIAKTIQVLLIIALQQD